MLAEQFIQKTSDTAVGASLAAGGTLGFTIQSIVEWASYAVTLGNLVLVGGGIYIMVLKLRKSRNQDSPKK